MYKFLEQTVDGYMTRNVRTVKRDLDMLALSEMFEHDDFNSYPVKFFAGKAAGNIARSALSL